MLCDQEHHHLRPTCTVEGPISELEVTGIQNSNNCCVLKSYLEDIKSVMSQRMERSDSQREDPPGKVMAMFR